MTVEGTSLEADAGIGAARGILLAGAVALLASEAVNAAVAALATASSLVPRVFDPLSPARVAVLTALGVLAGVGVFALVGQLSRRGPRTFRRGLAGLGLLLPLGLVVLSPRLLPVWAAAGLVVAAGLFAAAPGLHGRPRAAFRLVAVIMLALSYLPDLAILVGPLAPLYQALWQPDVAAVATLMLLHTLAAGITLACLAGPGWPGRRMAS